MKMRYKLVAVKNEVSNTGASDSAFLLLIQRAALLGLKDMGLLNQMQHRHAEEALLRQYSEQTRAEAICDD